MDATDRARSLADRYWEEMLQLEPLVGTMVGDERYDDRLSDPSEAGIISNARRFARPVSLSTVASRRAVSSAMALL